MIRGLITLLAAGSICLFVPASLAEQGTISTGNFNVMSFGIDGRKWSNPVTEAENDKRITHIGKMMSEYNYSVINVQGDLDLKSHNALYEFDRHPFRTTIPEENRSFEHGQNTLSNYSWVDFTRIWWNRWGDNSNPTKGFTFMRVRIYEGVYIDMINLDTEVAGTRPVDPYARLWNIQQVADFIDANSAGNAVIVVGNTHSLYTSFRDNIRLFTFNNGLTDAWVQAIGGNAPARGADVIVCPPGVPSNISCEGIDKVFYRGSPIIDLSSSGFFYETSRFLSPQGVPLVERNPIRVEFVYTLKPGLRQSDLCGGPYGTWFNDLPSIPPSPKLSSITFRGGRRLDGLTLTLASGQTFIHGGWGGNPYSLALTPGEYITSVKLCWGKRHGHTRNFYAEATTNKGQSLRAGKMTNDCATATAPIGYGVVGTYGQAGDEMDQLGFIYAEQASSAEPF